MLQTDHLTSPLHPGSHPVGADADGSAAAVLFPNRGPLVTAHYCGQPPRAHCGGCGLDGGLFEDRGIRLGLKVITGGEGPWIQGVRDGIWACSMSVDMPACQEIFFHCRWRSPLAAANLQTGISQQPCRCRGAPPRLIPNDPCIR